MAKMLQSQFSFSDPNFPGLAKVIEESGEVTQLFGKLVLGGDTAYFDGRDLETEMLKELADLKATIEFFQEHYSWDMETLQAFNGRVSAKRAKFNRWREDELNTNGQPSMARLREELEALDFHVEFVDTDLLATEPKSIRLIQNRLDRTLHAVLNRNGNHTIGHSIGGRVTTAPQNFTSIKQWVSAYGIECSRCDHEAFKGEE